MNAPLLLTLPRPKLSLEDYYKMGEAGILGEDSRVELIEGELIDMAPIGSRHVRAVNILTELLVPQARGVAVVSVQNPVSLPPDNGPQPDIALLKPRADDYGDSLPTAQDVLLIIEVADTTAKYDREVKAALYARHGVQEFWLVDLQEKAVEIYQEPGSKGYRKLLRPESVETISPVSLPDVHVPLGEIWPA
jgi:Uma2 family endonuclease